MTENNNEPWKPINLPSSLETNPAAKEPEERPAFPGELPPSRAPQGASFPPGVEGPGTRSGETTVPAGSVAPEPYTAPAGEPERSYDEILREAQGGQPQVNLEKNPGIPGLETRAPEAAQNSPYGNANTPTYTPPNQPGNFPAYPGNNVPGPNGQPVQTTNAMAVVALVLSIFCMGLIAIPLAIVALFSAKKRGQKGKGMAIAAIGISIVEIILAIVGTLAMVSFYHEIVEQCESGNPDPAYVDACRDYNATNDNFSPEPTAPSPDSSF